MKDLVPADFTGGKQNNAPRLAIGCVQIILTRSTLGLRRGLAPLTPLHTRYQDAGIQLHMDTVVDIEGPAGPFRLQVYP